jgi:tRNA modification GTPase
VVTVALAIDGWPVELADTAGLRAGEDALEVAGIDRARGTAAAADLCLWVLDGSSEPVWPVEPSVTVRLLVNKVDLPPAWNWNQAEGAIRVSAQTGQGLPELCDALSGWLVPEVTPPGAAVPFTERQCTVIEQARQCLAKGEVEPARKLVQLLITPAAD